MAAAAALRGHLVDVREFGREELSAMEPFSTLSGIAVPLDEANLDTNQLCPTRFNKVPRGPRFAQILLHDRRFNADGSEKPDYILNQEPYRHAVIAVAGRNFGIGSSRETAVFGLIGFGIRQCIAPNFGDIFFNNASRTGCCRCGCRPQQWAAYAAVARLSAAPDDSRSAKSDRHRP